MHMTYLRMVSKMARTLFVKMDLIIIACHLRCIGAQIVGTFHTFEDRHVIGIDVTEPACR